MSINHLSAKTVSFQSPLEELTPANISAWTTYWRDRGDDGHGGSDQRGISPCSHSYNKSGSGIERLLKDFKEKWAVLGCCVFLCCSPPHPASAYYLLPRSLYLHTNGLRVSRARARCHGRPSPERLLLGVPVTVGFTSGFAEARVDAALTAAPLIYNFRDVQNNTVDNIRQVSACEFPLFELLTQKLPLTHNFLSAAAGRIHNLCLG